ncbi:hypothetical protein [Thalassotalea marina]|uniref:Uncharacterized protein n=1 Tax=Thalassotalea marina TaxID=1673741 RepID=A0A919BRQ4_9GAMM|nr:hypothetical protein [Thalassotalea marina]GHG07140.1 hypothetical protein GCM10017161_41030 [Thalassotalea marina]
MSSDVQKLVTPSGREYPADWARIYFTKLSYFSAFKVIIKLVFWHAMFKPGVSWGVWLIRLLLPFFWLVIAVLFKGEFIGFVVVGGLSLIIFKYIFENERGKHKRLSFCFGLAIPLVLVISPLLALFIMGDNRGLGKATFWTDLNTFNPTKIAFSAREHHVKKNIYR